MQLHPGDHVCAIYTDEGELADIVAHFLAEGLRRRERCWYLPAGDSAAPIQEALGRRHVDVAATTERGALRILSSDAAYNVRGDFDPEETMTVFSNAIEEALSEGFIGFRAAANMSWALNLENGAERLITYEALLRTLFSTARATGLCLYDSKRMPLQVIDGALSTHPVVRTHGAYQPNPYYDSRVRSLRPADETTVADKLSHSAGRHIWHRSSAPR
jgi:DcmR-like sensory protein